jgi:hypothetical protein
MKDNDAALPANVGMRAASTTRATIEPAYLRKPKFVRWSGLSLSTVNRAIAADAFVTIKVGSAVLIEMASAKRWLEGKRVETRDRTVTQNGVEIQYLLKVPTSAAVPEGKVVVHNNVRLSLPLGRNGFRAWLQKPEDNLEVCTCSFAPALSAHYRIARPATGKAP